LPPQNHLLVWHLGVDAKHVGVDPPPALEIQHRVAEAVGELRDPARSHCKESIAFRSRHESPRVDKDYAFWNVERVVAIKPQSVAMAEKT
jgi:hypothetical protein